MKATEFEYRHRTLVHQFIVGAAFLTYFVDRDDIIWRFVKESAAPRSLERSLFMLATAFVAAGAGACTWARSRPNRAEPDSLRQLYLGDLLYAIGLGSLAPLSGFFVLVGGEAIRVFRLIRRVEDHAYNIGQSPSTSAVANEIRPEWKDAVLHEAVKWGILFTMIVFVITLKDRVAEVLATASFLVGLACKTPIFRSRTSERLP